MSHYVYIVECSDGTLYTGYTTDIERRLREHNAGNGAKYTRGRTPVSLRHSETFDSRGAALAREHAIKCLSRSEKDALVASE
ncbi:MAG TPA: GIY-YIG nuclease family protein [Halococcus sp.]|nr:GIY-YIG nuclease family protein [Halococcus sp.]